MLSACGRFSPQLFRKNVCKDCFKTDAQHTGQTVRAAQPDSPEKAAVETVVLSAHDTPVRVPRRSILEGQSPRSAGVGSPGDGCSVCHGHVYLAEKMEVNGMKFHKKCFKCHTCSISLSTANCVGVGGFVYCRSHSKAAEAAHKDRRGSRNLTPPAAKADPATRPSRLSHSAASSPLSAPAKKAVCASFKPHAYRANQCRDCLNERGEHGAALSNAGSSHSITAAPASSLHKAANASSLGPTARLAGPAVTMPIASEAKPAAFGDAKGCGVCTKTVYFMDKIETDGKVFHKWCFRCAECNKTLNAGNYAGLHGRVYCKPHFKALFKLKGNYDEGFGHQQHKHNWSGRAAGEEASGAPESPAAPAVSADRPPARALHTAPIASPPVAAAPAQTPAGARTTFSVAAPPSTARTGSNSTSSATSRSASKESLGARSTSRGGEAAGSAEKLRLTTPAGPRRKSMSSPSIGGIPASPSVPSSVRTNSKGAISATPRVASTSSLRTTPSPKTVPASVPFSSTRTPFSSARAGPNRRSSDA